MIARQHRPLPANDQRPKAKDCLRAVFFDVGGTLIHPDIARLAAPLVARRHPEERHLLAAERAAKCPPHSGQPFPATTPVGSGELGAHAGPVNRGYWYCYFEALLDAMGCGHELLPELTARAGDSDHWCLVDPAAPAALQELRRHYRLGIISNADGHIDRVLRRGNLDIYFDAIIDSGSVGVEKPDARIFHAGLEQLGTRPEQSLYVGDIHAIDYQGARAAGMQAVLVDPNGVYRDWEVDRIGSLSELPQWMAGKNERKGL